MSEVACSDGCFCCHQRGDGGSKSDHAHGCCHSTLCDSDRWVGQVKTWLRLETKWKRENDPEFTRWLIAEKLWEAAVPAWLEAETQWRQQITRWELAKEEFRQEMRSKQAELMASRVKKAERKGRVKQTSATVMAQAALSKASAPGHGHP